jgi:S1-C subfamily serine protease
MNRWAKPPGGSGSKPSSSFNSPNSSSSSSRAQLTAPDSGLMAVSSQPGEGPFVLVRAVSEMSPGDEVTLDYLAPGVEGSLVTPERRQAALLQRWGFRCR